MPVCSCPYECALRGTCSCLCHTRDRIATAPRVELATPSLDLRLKHVLIAGDCPSGLGEVWAIAANGGRS